MRRLNTSDLIKTATLLGKIGKQVQITEEMSTAQIGITLFSTVMQYAESDLKSLLAGIAEMDVEEFEQMPFDYPLEVIEQLAETEDLNRFFDRVKTLQRKLSRQ
jgi:hypothetical protein